MAELLEEEEAGIADLDCGEGKACDDRWSAGEDIEPCLNEGVM